MQFTRLRLNGFKSFVDPTDLVIADGLTGVVGPNGCGKSNLLEALRWVMGENRPTAMRGGGMEDVIFAGTSSRPARNFAEVSLVIDNADRLAPATFNDADQIDIVRRITRDAGSAYKAQGRDVRARDVQMLFADASTGAHSPALVRQGQISELIHAKPKNRRRILEEAAGISGLYQRRHEAELKLKGAEANLARLDDTIDALAAQLQQLARQAKQAARYRQIGDRLRRAEGLLLYRRWREAEEARGAADATLRDRATAAATAERAALEAARLREEADGAMPALREEDAVAAALVQRLEVEAATLADRAKQAEDLIARLSGRLRQLDRDAEREAALNADADQSIAALEDEATRLRADEDGYDDDLTGAAAAADEAARILGEREGALAALTEDVARLAARHQSAQRLLDDSRAAVERSAQAESRAKETVAQAEAALADAESRATKAGAEQDAARALADRAEAALDAADAARARIQSEEAEARAARSEATGALGTLRAEHQALSRLVARDAEGGESLMDRLRVDTGFEAAIGAALADDLRAPLVTEGTGWVTLDVYDDAPTLPAGATPLADAVDAPPALSRRLALIGVVNAAAGDAMQAGLPPGQRLVSTEGHLWRWDGYRARPEDAPSQAALRLQQRNRLNALTTDLEALEAQADAATKRHAAVEARAAELARADADARTARREADARVTELSRALSRAEADRDLATGRLETAREAVARHAEDARSAAKRFSEAEAGMAGLADLEGLRTRVADVKLTVEAARMTTMAKRAAHDELRREGAARTKRLAEIEKDVASWRARLSSAGGRLGEIASRRDRTATELSRAEAAPAEIAAQQGKLTSGLQDAQARRGAAKAALEAGETALREATLSERTAERAAGEARESRAAAEAQADATRAAVTAAAERIREDLDQAPETLLEQLAVSDPDALPPAREIEDEIATLRRQRDALGAVNLRAEEDAKEVEAEHTGLVTENADLEAAIAELRKGIAGLNREGRERLLTAFEEVNASFGTLFKTLFGGGDARLELIESDDPLDAGLEILCQPPGKKLSTLSLLSGGEQTLTAMALIFAVFLANPAPICVLDEVDAPLDDANVTRFCDLLDEMTRQTDTRFLIITHHAVTMARMDRLFGVTMGEQGVSQLVSVDLKNAEAMVA
ncbi:Chromosome partition protein Smc [Rhodobacteraceae bacterium THAF1]|uniref:chromosome segregation protein SMC n=1 Tax=Palleronia sp. THAF1 TaxID=2587842 RepID=UPI000F3D0D3C|nr:chromosome segregation protein SMC [Palleronia sp. THAF1]QFU09992.1 Chromosome partition protein Smc [Palleronia sp. THAF1]VDC17103.1 Chromosome partition protein Smc [Rhodobacteraceae bacterium THAF1]